MDAIWILVWILTFQPNEKGFYEWTRYHSEPITHSECTKRLAKKEITLPLEDNYAWHEIFCTNMFIRVTTT